MTLPGCTQHRQQIPWCDVREALLLPETLPYEQLAGEKVIRLRARWRKTICAFLLQLWMLVHLQAVERLKDLFLSVLVVWSLMTWHSSAAPSWALLHRLQCSRPPAAGYQSVGSSTQQRFSVRVLLVKLATQQNPAFEHPRWFQVFDNNTPELRENTIPDTPVVLPCSSEEKLSQMCSNRIRCAPLLSSLFPADKIQVHVLASFSNQLQPLTFPLTHKPFHKCFLSFSMTN